MRHIPPYIATRCPTCKAVRTAHPLTLFIRQHQLLDKGFLIIVYDPVTEQKAYAYCGRRLNSVDELTTYAEEYPSIQLRGKSFAECLRHCRKIDYESN